MIKLLEKKFCLNIFIYFFLINLPPNPKWNPRALKQIGKFDMLILSFAHKMNRIKSGAAHNKVKRSDTTRGGRFSGSRN
jgi:hypothetical protein